jgi:hypothetical protein|tara:strand:+ start:36 stop:518 length:483 start_codon:yes stop_codon:yes gene_type:complete
MLTLAAVIILSVMYRFATKNSTSSDNLETMETEINIPQTYIFISADIEEANSLLKNAHSEYEKNNFTESAKKTQSAIFQVLSQLLKYFDIQNEENSVENMFQILHKKGVVLPAPQPGITRLDEIFKKANEDKLLTKEEIQWLFHVSSHIIENSKEVRIKE